MTLDNGGEASVIDPGAVEPGATGAGVTMPSEPATQTESPVAPEAARQSNNLALQMRLALGGTALDKNKTDIPEVTETDLVREHDANKDDLLKKMSVASTVESLRTWVNLEAAFQQNGDTRLSTHEGKLDVWKQAIIKKFALSPNQAVITELRGVKIGAGSDALDFSNMDDATAQKLYDRYFKNSAGESNIVVLTGVPEPRKIPANIKRFIDDIHASHQDSAGDVDYAAIKTHLHSIGWLAKIFGPISADIITEYLESEINYQSNRQEFINQANVETNGARKVNTLNDVEKGLLNFIQVTNSQATYESTAAPPAPPIIPTPSPIPATPAPITVRPIPPARPATLTNPDTPLTLSDTVPFLAQITEKLKTPGLLKVDLTPQQAERFIQEIASFALTPTIKKLNKDVNVTKADLTRIALNISHGGSVLDLEAKIKIATKILGLGGDINFKFVLDAFNPANIIIQIAEMDASRILRGKLGAQMQAVGALQNTSLDKTQVKNMVLPGLKEFFARNSVNLEDFDFTIANDKITISLKSA